MLYDEGRIDVSSDLPLVLLVDLLVMLEFIFIRIEPEHSIGSVLELSALSHFHDLFRHILRPF